MTTLDQIITNVIARKAEGILNRKSDRIAVKVNDFDTRTMQELKRDNFSGLRASNMMMRFELWLIGRLHATLPYSTFFSNPNSLTAWYSEAFGLDVELDKQTHGAVLEVEARKAASYYYDEIVLKGKKV